MTKSLLWSVAVLAALALAACSEDAQTTERGIDQDITATHDAGAPTVHNLGQSFAPWRLNMAP
jgi:predicted small secreted protein